MTRPDEPYEPDVERSDVEDAGVAPPETAPESVASTVPDDTAESAPEDGAMAGQPDQADERAPDDVVPDDVVPATTRGDVSDLQDEAEPGVGPEHRPEPATAPDPFPTVAPDEPASAWRRMGAALRPRMTRSQVLAGVLCAAVGFALAVQVRQSASDHLSSARQDELVRLLDDVTVRAERLDEEVARLEETRDELRSGSGQARAALELARERAESEGILSGRLPAEGPGVELTIEDPGGGVQAAHLFNVLEELRNAGSEAVELNGVRLVTSSWFVDGVGGIVVDDHELSPPYRWTVIGDPATMDRALEIPGGALATVRTEGGGEATTSREDRVEVTAVRPPEEPQFADPQEGDR
jgi:uncharacterized protein YlxW (UPF0749 family)